MAKFFTARYVLHQPFIRKSLVEKITFDDGDLIIRFMRRNGYGKFEPICEWSYENVMVYDREVGNLKTQL